MTTNGRTRTDNAFGPFSGEEMGALGRLMDRLDVGLSRREAMPWQDRVRAYVASNPRASHAEIAVDCNVSKKRVIELLRAK